MMIVVCLLDTAQTVTLFVKSYLMGNSILVHKLSKYKDFVYNSIQLDNL